MRRRAPAWVCPWRPRTAPAGPIPAHEVEAACERAIAAAGVLGDDEAVLSWTYSRGIAGGTERTATLLSLVGQLVGTDAHADMVGTDSQLQILLERTAELAEQQALAVSNEEAAGLTVALANDAEVTAWP